MTTTAIISPITIGLVQVVKQFEPNKKWLPLFSIAFSTILAFLFISNVMPITAVIICGILAGLSASGLYTAVKTVNE